MIRAILRLAGDVAGLLIGLAVPLALAVLAGLVVDRIAGPVLLRLFP